MMFRLWMFTCVAMAYFFVPTDGAAQWFGGMANQGYHASTVAEGEGNAISGIR